MEKNLTFGTPVEFRSTQKAKYKCAKGHELVIHGTWTSLSVTTEGGAASDYNFCMMCWGEWAQDKWPLTREEL